MKIGELAGAAGVRTSLIRYYEAHGVLPAARRCGNARRYDASDLARLRTVRVARRLGFSLDQIRGFVTEPSSLRTAANERAATIDAAIRRARVVRVLLRHASAHGCFAEDRYTTILDLAV